MKLLRYLMITFIMISILMPATVFAYKPVSEGLDDIRWFGGYNPASGLSVISDVPKGVRLVFKKDPIMWANRVVAGWDYNLSSTDSLNAGVKPDEEGVYIKFEDIKWDIPKATPSVPDPQPSLMVSLSNSQGGWSDGPAIMFWIIRTKENYQLAILRGYNSAETNQEQFALTYTPLQHAIGSEINFYLFRSSAKEWTLRINQNTIKLDHATIIGERFSSFNPMGLSIGTWDSGGPVECTVSELWGYNTIEYGGKKDGKYVINPAPAFVKTVKTEKPTATIAPTKSPTKGATSTTTSKPTAVSSDETVSVDSDVETDSSLLEDSIESEVEENSEDVTESQIESLNTDESSEDILSEDENGETPVKKNPLIWIILAIVVVIVGGGVGYYFLFMKKNDQ